MNKKFLVVGMAAILGASLSFFGCESATGSDGSAGAPGPMPPATLPAGATPELLQAYYDSGVNTVFMVDAPGSGTFTVPEGKTLAVVGTVNLTTPTVIIDAYYGTLDVSRASFTNATNTTFIVPEAKQPDVKAAAPTGKVPKYMVSIPAGGNPGIQEDVVFANLVLGAGGTPAGDFTTFAGSTYTIYVPGTVTIDMTDAALSTGSVKLAALGVTEAKGTTGAGLTLGSDTEIGTLKATGDLKIAGVSKTNGVKTLDLNGQAVEVAEPANIDEITSSLAGSELVLGDAKTISKLTVESGKDIEVTSEATTQLTVTLLSTPGTGKLVLPAETVAFTATGTTGGGNISYAATPATLTLSSAPGLTHVGALTVTGAVAVTGAFEVNGDLTAASVGATSGNLKVTGSLTASGAVSTTNSGDIEVGTDLTAAGVTSAGGLKVDGTLTATGATTIEVGGDLEADTVVLGAVDSDALAVTGTANIGTLTGGGDANEISFGGETNIGTFNLTTHETVITASESAAVVTINNVTGIATDKTLIIKGEGVVKLSGTYTIGEDVSATDIGVTGGEDGIALGSVTEIPDGVTLYVKGSLTIPASGLSVAAGGELVIMNNASLDLNGATSGLTLVGGDTAGKLTLGDGDAGTRTVIAAAAAASDAADGVTDATLTASGDTATITVAAATKSGTSTAFGTSAAAGDGTNATITTGTNKADAEAEATFANATAVATVTEDASEVVPDAGGFGAGVSIAGGVITVGPDGATGAEE
jgi:hypothetical protein